MKSFCSDCFIFSAPSTTYYVWIKAFTWKKEGLSSSRLSIQTDLGSPASPGISNISCLSNNMVSVEWGNVNREGEVCDYILRLEDEAQVLTFTVNGSRDSEYVQVSYYKGINSSY